MSNKAIEIFPAPDQPRMFLHEQTGELFQYRQRGGAPKSVWYHGPHDARTKAGKRLEAILGTPARLKAESAPEQAPELNLVEMTEQEREIRNDLKAMLGKTKQEPGAYLSALSKTALQLSMEWASYQAAERAKMKVPVDGFLAPDPDPEPEPPPEDDSSK